jgi:hypothetical protein
MTKASLTEPRTLPERAGRSSAPPMLGGPQYRIDDQLRQWHISHSRPPALFR